MTKKIYYVNWKVPTMTGDKVHQAGPYHFLSQAEENRADIAGFEGVTDVTIRGEEVHEEAPAPVAPAVPR